MTYAEMIQNGIQEHFREEEIFHYGMPMRSGRYPYGSGDDPNQRNGDFLSRIKELKKEGVTYKDEVTGKTLTGDTAIARTLGMTTSQYRVQYQEARFEERSIQVATARGLKEKGMSLRDIAKEMGFANDSSVRSLLDAEVEAKKSQGRVTADFLKAEVDKKGMIDVGAGVEKELGISPERMRQALYILEADGYPTYGGGVKQVTNPGKQTNLKVLCKPGTQHKEIYDVDKIKSITDYTSPDQGVTFEKKWVYPKSLSSDRVFIRYSEDGGTSKDGVVELRRGVDDISLGKSKYAQVRILVDNDRYIKGMAMYGDDIPDGYDMVFNTNKSNKVDKRDVLKKISDDPDNPFGSLIKEGINDPTNPNSDNFKGGQSYYIDKNGKKQLSVINKRAEEGDWGEWSDKLSSQFLGKQNISLINSQLNLAKVDKQSEFDEIMKLTNPTIKKAMLNDFADDCDSSAVYLRAAALPRQKYQVILPFNQLKDNEVYAPNYKNGEQVALVRFPHGGTFEIPILTVNNKKPSISNIIGKNPLDAIGINSKIAEQLSGADFDGDTVMVIPTGGKTKITSRPPLEGLKNFDAKLEYGGKPEGTFKPMKTTNKEMGVISNLITDMTLRGANSQELARAVKHSMVVIDAEKHKLDYKQSEIDNGIASLKKKYQGHIDPFTGNYKEGASTLLSRSKSEASIEKTRGSAIIDPNTGKVSYKKANETYIDPKTGKTVTRMQKSTKMAVTEDAMELVSTARTPQEMAYANYANTMKSLANDARKAMVNEPNLSYNPQAKKVYEQEVKSLDAKLNLALSNAPKERQAQLIANSTIKAKKQSNPDMTKSETKKASQRALAAARVQVGAKRENITITPKEWEAIQAGAISNNKLSKIVTHSDKDVLRQLATPRQGVQLSTAKVNKIAAMKKSGYTTYEIADAIGVSSSTVSKYF